MDGSSNRQVRGASVALQTPEGDRIECIIHLHFPMTNNEAKYEALIAGLDLTKVAGTKNLIVHCNS